MELDVHLTRDGEEPWGFELVGGADYGVPLTVEKVFPSTPAHNAGLQPGDIVARLGDRLATELSLEAALATVAEAVGSLSFGICRGLYDPVVDDYEPIYEPIDRADSDLRSEPTEVPFPIQQFEPHELFLDDPNVQDPRITDPSMYDSGYLTRPVTETRSLTASPFVPNTKPYRPFSTEPLEAPPLDDPIILNPNYKDAFGYNNPLDNVKELDPKEEELLRLIPLEKNVKSIFKLPVSEKYDPDWEKKVKEMLEKSAEGGKRETEHVEHELVYYDGKATDAVSSNVQVTKEVKEKDVRISKEVKIHEEVKRGVQMKEAEETFEKKMQEEIFIEKIEQAALQVVEESIERALSVTAEIQNEVEEELRASATRELQDEETEATSEIKTQIKEVENKVERKKSVSKSKVMESVEHETEIVEKTNQETEEEIKVSEIQDEKLIKDQQFVEERNLSTKKETKKTIETGNVERKSSATRKVSFAEQSKSEQIMFPSEGKQNAFMIGLQTIPHIKGFVQSSYHFDLLLRTFFVHLTDVMVALSRFILTQPTAELEGKAEKVINEKLIKEFGAQDSEQYERKKADSSHKEREQSVQSVIRDKLQKKTKNEVGQDKIYVQAKQETKVAQAEVRSNIQQESREYKKVNQEAQLSDFKKSEDNKPHQEIVVQGETSKKQVTLEFNFEEVEKKKKSGAEMAQMTQRKSKDLTNKMDAVISEFETKTAIDDKLEVTEQSRRRSRSRSQIEEEVRRESDPLEWLDKVDGRSASQERTDVTTVKKGFSAFSESKECRKSETKRESRSTEVKPGKQMYIAIVESHVYTNKDAILEDQVAEMSETASVQSSEEINAAIESLETMSIENVAISEIQTEGKQQAVEIISDALQEVVQEKQEVLEAVTDFKSHKTEQHSNSVMQESHASVAAESTEIVLESIVDTFETKKIKECKAVPVQKITYKTAAVEFNVPLEATKEVIIEPKVSKQEAYAKQEFLATVAAESTQMITDESKLENFETEQMAAKTATISAEEDFKVTALSTTEMLLESSTDEKTESKVSEKQSIANVESLAIAVAESADVIVDDSKVEIFESKDLITKMAQIATEDTFKAAAVGSIEVTFEEVQEQHLDTAQTGQVTIRHETQSLPVAGIIETKTEVCKEPKKPAEDEYASLKIVREAIIMDSDESVEILSESETNIKNSLEVDVSSFQHIHSSISQSQESCQSISQEITSAVKEPIAIHHSSADSSKLHIRTDLAQQIALERQISGQSDENINTPSPSTDPPTPLTDEYVFRLETPLPKNQGTIVVEESPDREDPHIVKKGLIPHIEIVIEDQIIYDPPLPTPPEDKVQPPVYTKPGLRGGAEPLVRKEYIREIERKSSLLASAIDQTIKSIEEYKEEVGIEKKNVVSFKKSLKSAMKSGKHEEMNGFNHANGFSNGHGEIGSKLKEEWEKVETQVTENNENLKQLTNGNEQSKGKVGGTENAAIENEKEGQKDQNDALPGFKPVLFNPEAFQANLYEEVTRGTCEMEPKEVKMYLNESGEPLGTTQGIVDGLEDAIVDEEVAKELGKPGLTEDKIAELISGESEMLREAHVMGLARVLTSHMTRHDSSVDFTQIKPLVESLKDSEVLKALNEELMRQQSEEKKKKEKKEEQKWTTFMQKPKRPVPRAKFGYFGYVEPEEDEIEEPYKVKIVKQPKPKVAPDYKPEDFETGPLPWEERALTEPVPSPIPPEEPILVPEETPEFLEAVDPLPESEVPDLEDTGIPLPQPPPSPPTLSPEPVLPELPPDLPAEPPPDPPEPEVEPSMHGNQNQMAEQLVNTVRSMVDPNASLELQLNQMRAQLATLAQLPSVIQQSLELLTKQLSTMNHQEAHQVANHQESQVAQNTMESIPEYQVQEADQNNQEASQKYQEQNSVTIEEVQPKQKPLLTEEEYSQVKREEVIVEEQRKSEKERKVQQEKLRLEHESRQIKQRASPRVGKPTPMFGPLAPEDRPVVLPGGRRWRGPKDAYNEQLIAETLQAQSELLMGKVLGYESDLLPYDDRINFMKYEKPPVNLDHLQNSETYKMIHNLEQEPLRKTDLRIPAMSEADYRERCRSVTPMHANGRM